MIAYSSRIVLACVISCLCCVLYFQTLDLWVFQTKGFTPVFQFLLAVNDERTAWFTAVVCGAAALWRSPWLFERFADIVGASPRLASLAAVAALALASALVYGKHPLSMDEYAAVLQSKIFAHGRIAATLPSSVLDWLVVPRFNGAFLLASHETGLTIEQYWPGFALLLAPFELCNVPWLCNPILAGIALVLIHDITIELTGSRRSAGWAMIFALLSGSFTANAISFYSMQAHLTLNLLFVRLLIAATAGRAFWAGVVGSLALVLHNPVPHTFFAAPWLLHFAWNRQQRRFFPYLITGYLFITIAIGFGWMHLRTLITGEASAVGVVGATATAVLTLPDLFMVNMRVAALAKMWVWSVPGLYVLAVYGRLANGGNPHVRLLGQSALLTFFGYFFFYLDQGHGWGYRYFHGAFGVVPILAACALNEKTARDHRLAAFAGAACLLSVVSILPLQMRQIHDFISLQLSHLPVARQPGNNVYFINPRGSAYIADLVQIDPFLRSRNLLLSSRGTVRDLALVRQNWPDAVRMPGAPSVDQWYLGPRDVRQATDEEGDPHFVLNFKEEQSGLTVRH